MAVRSHAVSAGGGRSAWMQGTQKRLPPWMGQQEPLGCDRRGIVSCSKHSSVSATSVHGEDQTQMSSTHLSHPNQAKRRPACRAKPDSVLRWAHLLFTKPLLLQEQEELGRVVVLLRRLRAAPAAGEQQRFSPGQRAPAPWSPQRSDTRAG